MSIILLLKKKKFYIYIHLLRLLKGDIRVKSVRIYDMIRNNKKLQLENIKNLEREYI